MPKSFKRITPQAGIAHIFVIVIILAILLVIGVVIAANVKTTKEFSQTGSNVQGILIAKGDDDNSGSGSSGSGSSGSNSSGSSDDSSSSSGSGSSDSTSTTTTKTEFRSTPSASSSPSSEVRVKTETSDKQKTEVRFSEDEKIKTEIKNDRTRIDVYSGGVKVRYEIREGRVIVKAETEGGEGISEQELFKIEDRLEKTGIKVATEGGKLLLARNNIGAISNFPLQIDLNTNQLIASTSAGVRVLTTLPDQAVKNMLAANVISKLNTQKLVNQAQLGNLNSVSDVITLGERNGVPVYEINGLKEHKLLGFIPVTTEVIVFASAETGQPIASEQSLLSNIIDLISPQ